MQYYKKLLKELTMKQTAMVVMVVLAMAALMVGCTEADASTASATYEVEYRVQWTPDPGVRLDRIMYLDENWDLQVVENPPDNGDWRESFTVTVEEPLRFVARVSTSTRGGREDPMTVQVLVDGVVRDEDQAQPAEGDRSESIEARAELRW